jgi:hypothetical protein
MLNVRNLASLNASGRFLAREATAKLARAREPREPRTQQKAVREPLLHRMMTWPCSECASVSIKGGEVPSQIPQRLSWIRVQMGTMKFGVHDTSNHLTLLPGK